MSNGPCVLYYLSHWNKQLLLHQMHTKLFDFALVQTVFNFFGKAAAVQVIADISLTVGIKQLHG